MGTRLSPDPGTSQPAAPSSLALGFRVTCCYDTATQALPDARSPALPLALLPLELVADDICRTNAHRASSERPVRPELGVEQLLRLTLGMQDFTAPLCPPKPPVLHTTLPGCAFQLLRSLGLTGRGGGQSPLRVCSWEKESHQGHDQGSPPARHILSTQQLDSSCFQAERKKTLPTTHLHGSLSPRIREAGGGSLRSSSLGTCHEHWVHLRGCPSPCLGGGSGGAR